MQEIAATSPLPKYLQIAESMRRAIRQGKWSAGQQLPRFRELASHFQTTHPTMSRALERVEREGLIDRVHGKGIFVRGDTPPVANAVRVAAVIMRVYGHLYGDMFQHIVNHLRDDQIRAMPVDFTRWPVEQRRHVEDEIRTMFEMDVVGAIVDAIGGLIPESFEKLLPVIGTLVFVNHYEFPRPIAGANYVLADSVQSGYLAAQTLLRRGGRRLLALIWPRSEWVTDENWRKCPTGLMVQGMSEAMREAGLDPSRQLHLYSDARDRTGEELTRLLADDFDGVFCAGDALAPRVYHAAALAGRTVGADLPVLGHYNTPWTSQLVPSLSSITINEATIARRASELIRDKARDVFEYVKPELVERESTGGGKQESRNDSSSFT